MQERFKAGFSRSFQDAGKLIDQFLKDEAALDSLSVIAEKLKFVFESQGKVLIGGNGGSMADAMHFAEEWTGRFRNDRQPFPAMVLGGDPTHLSCVGNDYGFEEIFSRSVAAFANSGDLVILLSTSGNSENLVRAAHTARNRGSIVVGFLGKGGGKLGPLCDISVHAPGVTSDRIQEIHMLALHTLIEVVEEALGVA